MDSVIEAKGLTKAFAHHTILHDIHLSVQQGEFISIVGKSGSGKTTLLYCLSGLLKPTSGEIRLCGKNIGHMSPNQLALHRRNNLGFIFQNFCLIPSLNVIDNICLPLRLKKVHVPREELDFLLNRLDLQDKLTSSISTLSGGEQQRVAIARTFISSPSVVFADEPTSSLDTRNSEAVLELIKSLKEQYKTTVILVSHDLSVAAVAQKAYVIADGCINNVMESPTTDKLYAILHE